MHTPCSEVEDEYPATQENNSMADFPTVPQVEKEASRKVSPNGATNIEVDNFADVGEVATFDVSRASSGNAPHNTLEFSDIAESL